MDTAFIEMMDRARVAVENCMLLKPGEEALIVTDVSITEFYGTQALLQALMASIKHAGGEANMVFFTPRSHSNAEITRIAGGAMKEADCIFTFPTRSMTHTTAMRQALDNGARILMVGAGAAVGRTGDMLYRLFPKSKEELDKLASMADWLADKLRKGRKVHFTTQKGTDLTLEIGQLHVIPNTGVCKEPGQLEVLPCGMAACGVTPGTANGRIVVDGSIWPVPRILEQPVVLDVQDGMITSVTGGRDAMEWKRLAEGLNDPMVYNIAELGLGANPNAVLQGQPWEDERIYGSCHIGIGTNIIFKGDIKTAWHVDANVLESTVSIDGKTILKDGEYMV